MTTAAEWVAFLGARLDEDEVEAANDGYAWSGYVEAMRAILAMHQPEPFYGNNPPPLRDRTPGNAAAWHCQCQCPDGVIEGTYPCDEVRHLAAIWDGHPDYPKD